MIKLKLTERTLMYRMVSFHNRSRGKKKNNLYRKKTSKRISIKNLQEIMIKIKNDKTKEEDTYDDNDKIYRMRTEDSNTDENDDDEDFIDEQYEVINAKTNLIEVFTEKGLIDHLKSTVGGTKSDSSAITAVKRLIDYIMWMHMTQEESNYDAEYLIDEWYTRILQAHVGKIVEYCSHLEKDRYLAPQTIKNTLYDIKTCSFWYLMIYQTAFNGGDIWASIDYLITKCCKKENRRDRQLKSSGKSIESVIADRRWPVHGLKELQQSCKDEISKYVHMNSTTFIDEHYYNEFMKLIYATYYVFSIQGRIGAFSKLTYAQAGEMVYTGSTSIIYIIYVPQ